MPRSGIAPIPVLAGFPLPIGKQSEVSPANAPFIDGKAYMHAFEHL
jgi:hypothetical protein